MQVFILFQMNSKHSAKTEHRASSIIIIPSSEQQISRSMNQIYQVDTQKCYDTNSNPHIALLQIRSTPLRATNPCNSTVK